MHRKVPVPQKRPESNAVRGTLALFVSSGVLACVVLTAPNCAPSQTQSSDSPPSSETSGSPHEGELSRSDIAATLQRRGEQIAECYKNELDANPGLGGRIDFTWVIQQSGRATDLRVTRDELGNPVVAQCIRSILAELTFPEPKGDPVTINFPFFFRSSSPDTESNPDAGETEG